MKLLVDRLTTTPVAHSHVVPPEWLSQWWTGEGDFELSVPEGLHLEFEVHVMGEDIYLAGEIGGAIEVECGRCIKRYRQPLRDDFRLVLEPARDRVPPDLEGVEALERFGLCLGEDLEAGWYRGKDLVLDPFFAELVSLAMPVQPLCRADCAGLCPHCGIDRNQASCECTEIKPESPFAVLAALREGSEGSS
jgi:uncharacterized protein